MLALLGSPCLAGNSIPATPAGSLARGWLDSFNSGDVALRAKFLTEHDSSAAIGSAVDSAKSERAFRESIGGGFDYYASSRASDTEITAVLRERGGLGWAKLEVRLDAKNPSKASFNLHETPTPRAALPAREDGASLVKGLEELLVRLAAEDRFSGVVLVARNGTVLFKKAYGYADRSRKIRNDVDTRFRIGSMNKMFTSVAIAQLVQSGRLNYSDTLATLLPDYPDKEIAGKVTVHHLMTHTSGLGDYFSPAFDKKKDALRALKDYMPFFAGKPLKFAPGAGWSYSNAGMIVAGLIVERVSGENYFDYVRAHVYGPAGMKDSGTGEKTRSERNRAVGYTRRDGRWVSNYETLPLMGSSAGGGDSTAGDLLRFDQALRKHTLLNAAFTALVLTGKADDGGGDMYAYGFVERKVAGERTVGHDGGAPGMNAILEMYRDTGWTVIVLANRDPIIANQVNGYIRERIKP